LSLEQVYKLAHEPELIQNPGGILAALGLLPGNSLRLDTRELPD
jgi:hypothetical protein